MVDRPDEQNEKLTFQYTVVNKKEKNEINHHTS